jgi:hypothetical protein
MDDSHFAVPALQARCKDAVAQLAEALKDAPATLPDFTFARTMAAAHEIAAAGADFLAATSDPDDDAGPDLRPVS